MTKIGEYEFPEQIRTLAVEGVEQARQAFDELIGVARKTVTSVEEQSQTARQGAAALSRQLIGVAEDNVSATFAFAQSLALATSVEDLVRLHSEFLTGRAQAFSEQARSLGEAAAAAGGDLVRTGTRAADTAADAAADQASAAVEETEAVVTAVAEEVPPASAA